MSMWNKREEPPAPRPASAPPAPSPAPVPETRKEPITVSSIPHRTPETEPRNTAMIGKSVKVIGQIFTKEDLYVDGDVEGTIESQENKVTVGPNGRVQASIRARGMSSSWGRCKATWKPPTRWTSARTQSSSGISSRRESASRTARCSRAASISRSPNPSLSRRLPLQEPRSGVCSAADPGAVGAAGPRS